MLPILQDRIFMLLLLAFVFVGAPFLFTARAPRRFQDVAYPQPAVLIFGRESVGLDAAILERHAANTVALPMRDPELRSLNLSTSVALALYEVRRQWGWG